MLITIEKVAILSKTCMFAGIPDYVLASVAEIMEEVALNACQPIPVKCCWKNS